MVGVVLQKRLRFSLCGGEIVDGARDGLRKADAEDLRSEDRVESVPTQIESEMCRALIRLLSLGEMGETLLTQLSSTARLVTRLTRIVRIALVQTRVWILTLLRTMLISASASL